MIQIKIENLSSTGEGVGRKDGLTYFVEGALPGEEVECSVVVKKKNYAKAICTKVLHASPSRIQPPCPYFTQCGGCQIMALEYKDQLNQKHQRVVDAFTRIGGFSDAQIAPCEPSPKPLAYRNKIQLPVDKNLRIGLYAKRSHTLVPIEKCLIHCPLGERLFQACREKLSKTSLKGFCEKENSGDLRFLVIKSAVHRNEALVIFVTTGKQSSVFKQLAKELVEEHEEIKGVIEHVNPKSGNVIFSGKERVLAGKGAIHEQILGKDFLISPQAFFQVNVEQAETLYSKAIALASLTGSESVVDAYCGVGTLSLFASDHSASVLGIECVPAAIRDAKHNAKLNGVRNCTFICGKTEETLHEWGKVDAIFLNPPRKGCAPEVLQAIAEKRISRCIYISCHPESLARDCKHLVELGYSLKTVYPVDMFPQTMHIENVVLLER